MIKNWHGKFQLEKFLFLIGILVLFPLNPVYADSQVPNTAKLPPKVPITSTIEEFDQEPDSHQLNLPPLKAVLIVGPIDGDNGPATNANKTDMDKAANELSTNGVTVYKFYAPNNDWTEIKNAAMGANFLMYRGHGIYWSPMPAPEVGGFALSTTFVSNDMIRNDLRLAPNSIVMIYSCFSAGSAGNDTISISSAEAQRRVAMYSHPFLDIGAAGYFADWYGDAFQKYVHYLFEGKTLRGTYESFYDFNSKTVERFSHPDHPDNVMWLDKDYWYDPKPQYNNAFIGRPDARITDLFQPLPPPVMNVSATNIGHLSELGDPPQPTSIKISISTYNFGTLNGWKVIIDQKPDWLAISTMNGESGQELQLTFQPISLGVYQTQLKIVADDTSIVNREQTIIITFSVVNEVYHSLLPVIFKSG